MQACLVTQLCVCAKSLQSCLTLCDPMARSPPGSSVHGILQARMLEWAARLQGIFPTHRLNPHLLHLLRWQAGSLPHQCTCLGGHGPISFVVSLGVMTAGEKVRGNFFSLP